MNNYSENFEDFVVSLFEFSVLGNSKQGNAFEGNACEASEVLN